MAKIRNTHIPNAYGGGNVKEIKCDNGDTYHIRNTCVPNAYGGGNEQEIVKVGSNNSSHYDGPILPALLYMAVIAIIGFAITFIGVPWFFISIFG